MSDWSTRTKSAVVIVAHGTSAAVASLSLLVMGRLFQAEAFGMFAFAFGASNLVAVLTDLGLGLAHQRTVAQGADRRTALTVLLCLRLVLAALLGATCTILFFSFSGWIRPLVADTTTWRLILLALLYQGIMLVRNVVESTWLAEQRAHLVEGLRLVDSILGFAFLVNAGLMVAVSTGSNNPVGAAWLRLFQIEGPFTHEAGAVLILGSYLASRLLTLLMTLILARRDGISMGQWDTSLGRRLRRAAVPLSLAYVMAVVLTSTDVVMLGIFGAPRDVALYAAVQRMSIIGLLVTAAVSTILFPRFAHLHAAGDQEGVEATSFHAHRYLLLIVAPIVAAFVALPQQGLVATMGAEYRSAAPALQVLGLWTLVISLSNPIVARLIGEGRDRLVIRTTVLNALLNVVLNLLLIPGWGLGLYGLGAALATLASSLVTLVLLSLWSRQAAFHKVLLQQAPRVLTAAAVTGVVWWLFGALTPPAWLDQPHELLLIGTGGVGLYYWVLRLTRAIPPEDVQVLRRFMRPWTWFRGET